MKQKLFSLLILGIFICGSTSAIELKNNDYEEICDCEGQQATSYRTGLLPGGPTLPEGRIFSGNAPASWDWRSATYNSITGDWTTPIKNQGNCGSCYAFGSLASLESLMNIKNEDPNYDRDLSEQFMVSCGTEWVSGIDGCDGAYMSPTYNFLLNYGAIPESCFPYVSGSSGYVPPCSDKCSNWEDLVVPLKGWNTVSSNAESIKNALIQYGPLPTSMVVYEDFKTYNGGIYEHPGSDPDPTNHLVTIIGYDDAQNYWICKNSWGTGWGENGWFRIAYGDCHIEDDTVYLEYEAQSDVTATVEIRRIQKIDDIEGFLEGGADWSYRISVHNGNSWSEVINDDYSSDDDDHTETVKHRFNVFDSKITVTIKVWERDLISGDDLADVSGYTGGGIDNSVPDNRGAIYQGEYDLYLDEITSGDTTTSDSGYYVTSGEYSPDNSNNADENDAKVWFKVTDNYNIPNPDLDATGSLDGSIQAGSKHHHLGTFTVENIGVDPIGWEDSYLDWEIIEIPSWGSNWEFDPDGGTNLKSGDDVSVDVYVDVPTEQGTFSGTLKIWNKDNHGDYALIPIEIETPRNKLVLLNLNEIFKLHFWGFSIFPIIF